MQEGELPAMTNSSVKSQTALAALKASMKLFKLEAYTMACLMNQGATPVKTV
jgi:hypothetical protein